MTAVFVASGPGISGRAQFGVVSHGCASSCGKQRGKMFFACFVTVANSVSAIIRKGEKASDYGVFQRSESG